jgi:hypothetical protein
MALLDAKTLAAELGFSPKQIRRLAHRGLIPSMKFASEYRFDLEAVKAAAVHVNALAASARTAAAKAWGRPLRRQA